MRSAILHEVLAPRLRPDCRLQGPAGAECVPSGRFGQQKEPVQLHFAAFPPPPSHGAPPSRQAPPLCMRARGDRTFVLLIQCAPNSGAVQVTQGQEWEGDGAAGPDRGGSVAAASDGRAEFRELFVSLVDPAGVLDTDRAGEIAVRMEEAASRAGYASGARMARLLAETFADEAEIVNRPVEDGSLHQTFVAFRKTMTLLYRTAESYRDGGVGEPVGELEELRKSVAALRSEADAIRAEMRAADPPGSALDKFDALYRGRICKEVISKRIKEIRAEDVANGVDPIFTPEDPIDDVISRCEGTWSAAEIMDWARGKAGPEEYAAIRVESVQ